MAPEERCGWGQSPSPARVAAAAEEVASDKSVAEKEAAFDAWVTNQAQLRGYPLGVMFVPLHIQENWYYCGPASTLMALDFMNVDGGADQDALWAEVGVSSSSGSDSTLIAAALNSRQSTNYYIGGYYNMSGVNMSGFEYRWHYGFDHSTPAIPNIDTDQLSSYGGTNYEHFVTASGYDWGDDLVRYHDPNNLMHGGAYWDPQQDMLDAIQLRNSGLQSMVW